MPTTDILKLQRFSTSLDFVLLECCITGLSPAETFVKHNAFVIQASSCFPEEWLFFSEGYFTDWPHQNWFIIYPHDKISVILLFGEHFRKRAVMDIYKFIFKLLIK